MMGHNGADELLQQMVDRIERLEEEKAVLSSDISEIYKEAKSEGFDVKILRKVIALRKKGQREREEEEAMIETYMASLGMLADTPLGQAAAKRDGVAA